MVSWRMLIIELICLQMIISLFFPILKSFCNSWRFVLIHKSLFKFFHYEINVESTKLIISFLTNYCIQLFQLHSFQIFIFQINKRIVSI